MIRDEEELLSLVGVLQREYNSRIRFFSTHQLPEYEVVDALELDEYERSLFLTFSVVPFHAHPSGEPKPHIDRSGIWNVCANIWRQHRWPFNPKELVEVEGENELKEFDYRDEDRVVAVHFGDGATSEGDFHEAMNFAGVFDTPTVFFCNNNGWAISHPVENQTASDTIAVKADAYGMEGIRVDGMDPLACYAVTKEAVERARDPEAGETRPTLIEAVTYRFGAHTTADDPTVYRDDAEVERWKERDPLQRFEAFLRRTGRLDDERDAAIQADIEEHVAAVIDEASETEADPESMFDHAYADLPPELQRQREGFLSMLSAYGDEAFLRE